MEKWENISSTNGKYAVSNTGTVRRNKRVLFDKWGRVRITKEKIILPCLVGKGYLQVTLRIGNKNCKLYIHRLVAIEFVEKREGKEFVNHKDLNKINNAYSNLEWVSVRENANHWMQQKSPGVSRTKKTGKWSSRIMVNGAREFLGSFSSELDAKNAYEKRLSQV